MYNVLLGSYQEFENGRGGYVRNEADMWMAYWTLLSMAICPNAIYDYVHLGQRPTPSF